ncbi:MAG: hypothetical protein ABSE95_06160 [Thermodesulfobacteriota bacterium]|jgi:hypothetical protein
MSSKNQIPKDPKFPDTDLESELGEDFLFEEIEIEEDLEDSLSSEGRDIFLEGLDEELDEWEEYIDSHWNKIINEQ